MGPHIQPIKALKNKTRINKLKRSAGMEKIFLPLSFGSRQCWFGTRSPCMPEHTNPSLPPPQQSPPFPLSLFYIFFPLRRLAAAWVDLQESTLTSTKANFLLTQTPPLFPSNMERGMGQQHEAKKQNKTSLT